MRIRHRQNQRGANLLEFALVSIVLIPLVFGGISLGMRLGTHIQTSHLARDTGHMYARGIDFSKAANQQVLFNLGSPFRLSLTGGNATVILTQIRRVHDADCAAVRFPCGNRNRHVVVQRLVFGNSALASSRLASPAARVVNANGTISANDYLRDTSVVLGTTMENYLFVNTGYDLAYGEVAYIVETYTPATETQLFGLAGTGGVYSRAIF